MPTYEYECTECGHTFEAFQSISAQPIASCPECRGRVRRLIGGGLGVIFKGSGFYTTDYKRGSALAGGNGSKESGREGTKEKPKEKAAEPLGSAEKKPVS